MLLPSALPCDFLAPALAQPYSSPPVATTSTVLQTCRRLHMMLSRPTSSPSPLAAAHPQALNRVRTPSPPPRTPRRNKRPLSATEPCTPVRKRPRLSTPPPPPQQQFKKRRIESSEEEWTEEDDRILIDLVLAKLKLSKSEWEECARSLGKGDASSVGRRWEGLVRGIKRRKISSGRRLRR